MVALKGACRNYDALWYCLARCRDVGSDYNIFFFLFCSVVHVHVHVHVHARKRTRALPRRRPYACS